MRIRIDFQGTIRHREYDGLRMTVLHREQAVVDTTVLTFADHDTFARRDTDRGIRPGWDGYGRIRDWHADGPPPWTGADVTELRRAIEHYAQVWRPAPPPIPARRALPSPPLTQPGRSH